MQREVRRSPADVAEGYWNAIHRLDRRILASLRRAALPALRLSLAIVFIWFGLLKIIGETPVADLVASTVYWVDPDAFVPFLGAFEIAVGLGLLLGRALRVVLALFVLQMVGTFLVLVIQPDVSFQGSNPLLLTTEGEFVVKNLVLLSAGLTIGARLKALPAWKHGEAHLDGS